MLSYRNTLMSLLIMICLTACASSDVKQFGGNLAFANQSGEPISTAVTLALGGIIYGIGSLAESEEDQQRGKSRVTEKPLFENESSDENMTIKLAPLAITSSDVKSQPIENNVSTRIDSNNSL